MPLGKSKETKKRGSVAKRIEALGIDMSPCSFCERNKKICVVLEQEKSTRCSKCVRIGILCDVKGPSARTFAMA